MATTQQAPTATGEKALLQLLRDNDEIIALTKADIAALEAPDCASGDSSSALGVADSARPAAHSASRSVQRALLTPLCNRRSLYRCGKST